MAIEIGQQALPIVQAQAIPFPGPTPTFTGIRPMTRKTPTGEQWSDLMTEIDRLGQLPDDCGGQKANCSGYNCGAVENSASGIDHPMGLGTAGFYTFE
jgi:hypothetical protein